MREMQSEETRVPLRESSYVAWGAFNWKIPRGVWRTRRAAIEHIQNHTGEPWEKARHYYTVQKVRVTPL